MKKGPEEIIVLFIILAALCMPVIAIYRNESHPEIDSRLYILIGIVSIAFLLVLFARYRQTIERIAQFILGIARIKKIFWLIILGGVQVLLASVCYWAYYNNPKLYVIADEIKNGYVEITETNRVNELNYYNEYHKEVAEELKVFKYLEKNQHTFIKSSDGNLFVNDSLYVLFAEYPGREGVMQRFVKLYTKKNLRNLKTHFVVIGDYTLDSVIQSQIEYLEKKMASISNSLADLSIHSSELKWSYLHFLSYYFREQLQAMSPILILIDFIKY